MLRFTRIDDVRQSLGRLAPRGRIGVAVSGGPDSLALLLLAVAARPKEIEAATVDHGLRSSSAGEAAMVARLCAELGVPHATLTVRVPVGASLQAQARAARYAALGRWASERGLAAVATAHHADDQAETLLMRLARGSGLAGLSGVREQRLLGPGVRLVRPLLNWRKEELVALVTAAGLDMVNDAANHDPRHDRTWARALLQDEKRLDALRLAGAAAALAEAEQALAWAVDRLAAERIAKENGGLCLEVADLPAELQRRLLLSALERLGAPAPRGPDIERALEALRAGRICTLAGWKLEGGTGWKIRPAPPRRR